MAKRMQEQDGEKRIAAKSKPTTMNLAFTVSTSSSTVQNTVAFEQPWDTQSTLLKNWSSTRKRDAREFNRDAASSSQGWQKGSVLDVNTRRLVASGNSDTEGKDKIWIHRLRTVDGESFLNC